MIQIGDATLYCGDCLEILPTLGKVDAVVTSPPYYEQRDYSKQITRSWHDNMGPLSLLNHECQLLVNLGVIHRNCEVFEYWTPWLEHMKANGWRLFGWYVWDQQVSIPGDTNGRLAQAHEFIFHLNKKTPKVNKTLVCKNAGTDVTKGSTGLRRKNGTMSGWNHMGIPVQDYRVGESVIRITKQMARDVDHPAVFPVNLPMFLAESFTQQNETILDPFMGSGTTGVACAKLGRKFIGIEIEPRYFDIACKRIEEAYRQPDLFIEQPKPVIQEKLAL